MQRITLVDPFELASPVAAATAASQSPATLTPMPSPVAPARSLLETRPGNAFEGEATPTSDTWARARCWCSEE